MAEIIKIDQVNGVELVGTVRRNDTRTGTLYQQFGFSSLPERDQKGILVYVGNGSGNGVIIAGKNPTASPGGDQGETVIYSTSGGSIVAKIKLDSSGNVIINDGIKSAVSHAELNAALQAMITQINANFAIKLDGGGTPGTSTINISAAEVPGVKLP